MARDETQAMSTERLAEIRQRADDPRNYYYSDGTDEDYLIERELLAEVERLRARETALVEIVRWVAEASETHATPSEYPQASRLHFSGVGAAGWLRQKARALLAAGLAAQGAQDAQADGEPGEA